MRPYNIFKCDFNVLFWYAITDHSIGYLPLKPYFIIVSAIFIII